MSTMTSLPRRSVRLRNKNLPPLLLRLCQWLLDNDPTLTILKFECDSSLVEDDGTIALAEALSRNSFLKKLIFSYVHISAQGIINIVQGLVRNSSLASLRLTAVYIGNEGASALANILTNNSTSLAHLTLEKLCFGTEVAIAIAKSLETNTSLVCFELNFFHRVGSVEMEALGNALKHNATLEKLFLTTNGINCDGAKKLFNGLKQNLGLKSVHLHGNKIGDGGALALKDLLTENYTLRTIRLCDNEITSDGAIEIAKGLEANCYLEILDLWGNPIGNEGMAAFKSALQNKNQTLRVCTVGSIFCQKVECLERQVEFYCELNCSGRQHVRGSDIPTSLWPYILAKLNRKKWWPKDQLFWFLREKPDLFRTDSNVPQEEGSHMKKRKFDAL